MSKKIILVISSVICFILSFSNIYARKLEIKANYDDDYVTFYTVVKASKGSEERFGNNQYGKYIQVSSGDLGQKNDSYDIMGIIFHKEELSHYGGNEGIKPISYETDYITLDNSQYKYNYSNWGTEQNYNVVYVDNYNDKINLTGDETSDKKEIEKYLNYFGGDFFKITNKSNVNQNSINKDRSREIKNNSGEVIGKIFYIGQGDYFENPQYTLVQAGSEVSVVYKYQVDIELFKDGGELEELFFEKNETSKKIHVSFVTKTDETGYMYTAAQFYENIFRGKSFKDSIEKLKLETKIEQLKQQKDNIKNQKDEIDNKISKLPDGLQKSEMIKSSEALKRLYDNINMEIISANNQMLTFGNKHSIEKGTIFAPYTKGIDEGGTPQRGWATANDYDNILVLENDKDKTLYVNYLEEMKSGDLSVLYVAPKEQPNEHQISLDGGSTYENITLSKYKDYVIETNSNEYEEYKIPVEDKKKKMRFIYMTEAELNAKMNKDIEDEEEQYKYKYIKLKYLTGNTGEKYDILRDKILNGEGKVLTSKKAIKSIDDTKNFLVSFIYKNTKQKNKIDILVQHQDKYKNPLPIADGGNQYYEEGESIEKEKDSNKWITHYKGNAKKDNAYTELLVSEYTIEESEKVYKFKGKVKLEAYKTGSEKPDFTKNFHNQKAEKFIFSTSGFANQGYSKVVITYIYETEDTPPSGDDGELKVCPILSFTSTSNVSTTRDTCESKFDFSQKNECSEGETALYLPTGKEFNANIETEKYYVDEKFGIIQKITSTTAEVKILIWKKEHQFEGVDCCNLGKISSHTGEKEYTLESPELEANKCKYNEYVSMSKKNTLHDLGVALGGKDETVVSVKQLDDKVETSKVSSSYHHNGGKDEKTGKIIPPSHPTKTVYENSYKYAIFKVTYIKVEIVGFKSYYLGEIIFDNVNGDGTKFVDKNQRHSILEESIDDFDIDYFKDDMLNALNSKYSLNGFVSLAYCGDGDVSGCNYECEGWQKTTASTSRIWGQDYTGPERTINLMYQYKGNDSYVIGSPIDRIYAFNMVGLSEINATAHTSLKSKILNTIWDKYNGERLSIAKLTYHNYNWNYKLPENVSEKSINGIPVLVENSNKDPFKIEVTNKKNETTGKYELEYTLKVPRLFDYDVELNGIKKEDGTYEKKGLCSDALDTMNSAGGPNYNGQAHFAYYKCIGENLLALTGKTKEELKELYGINTPVTNPYFFINLGQAYLSPQEIKSESISGLQTFDGKLVDAILGRSDLYTVEEATNNKEVSTNSSGINIMNPAALDSIYVDSTRELVSQTLGNDKTFELQVGAETTIVPKISASDPYNLTLDERKNYIGYYVYEFNFPVEIISGNTINGKKFEADTPVIIQADTVKRSNNNMEYSIDEISNDDYYDYGGMIKFIPTGELASKKNNEQYLTSKVNIDTDTIYCTAVANNVPAGDIYNYYINRIHKKTDEEIKMYVGISQLCNDKNTSSKYTNNTYLTTLENKLEIRKDSRYFSNRVSLSTANISRLYEFRITDCTDVNFKNVFRVNSADTVNKHSGIVYFGGIRSIDVYNNVSKYIKENGAIKQNQNIMPLGPYKNTNKTYVEAPKLGYRISFDLKTSGSYRPDAPGDRTIIIFPKLYYISKDGKEFIDDVKAYYKDSTGKYVKIDQETDLLNKQTYINAAENKKTYNSYQITYIPNDGYRNVLSVGITNREDWFTKDRKTLNMSAIKLQNAMMCTNNDGFIQTWYGEYKLPNSTILLREEETNLNNYLKDGYCGVVFYIGVVEIRSDSTVVMCYNTNDKKASSQYNTTEWDYEGFLGFKQSNIGSKLQGTLNLQLAKGIWNIDDDTYQKIKGTVLLYDLDNRAASDFD